MSQKVDPQSSQSCSASAETSSSTTLPIPSSSLASQPQTSHKRTRLVDINAELTCILCNGYFIDATTICECLHSFCKSCIVKYLETNKCCPICEAQVHKTKPLLNIRSDKILQDMVYKLIPDVFKNEMLRRREFYSKHSEAAPTTAEDRGEVPEHRMFYMPYDKISLSLEYGYGDNQIPENGYRMGTTPANQQTEKTSETETMRRYLLCPAGLSILHLKKFIATKYGLPNTYKVDVMYLEDMLSEDYTLMDVAYIYAWRRNDPMRLFYRICERPIKRLKTTHPQTIESKSGSGSSLNNASNLSNTNNNNNNSVTQTKLVASQASTSTSNTSTLTTIMTGAVPLPTQTTTPTLKTLHSSNISNSGNNSGSTGVTSSKASIATPKNVDKSTLNAYRVTPSPTSVTPQGILKSKSTHVSASAVQTDEPPKKLRKILPANNSSATTPKTVSKHVPKSVPIPSINCTSTQPKIATKTITVEQNTSSSTVSSLRQCRINSDKNKLLCTSVSSNSSKANINVGLSASKSSSKEDKCVPSGNSDSSNNTTPLASSVTSSKKNSSRKSSAFDVRTLIGTQSPTLPSLPCHRQTVESAICGNEFKDEKGINHKSSSNTANTANNGKSVTTAAKQAPKGNSNTSVRDLNRNSVTTVTTVSSSVCSMPTSLSSVTTGSSVNKKPLSNSSSIAMSRPPTNTSTSPINRSNTKSMTPATPPTVAISATRPSLPLKVTKSGTNVSPKQLNAKSLKTSQNDISVKTCNTTRDVTSDNSLNKMSNKPITTPRTAPQNVPQNEAQRQSNPLSPTSIRIKLPPPPTTTTTKSHTKSGSLTDKMTTPLVSPTVQTHNHKNNNNNNKEHTNVSAQQSSRIYNSNECLTNISQTDTKKQLSDSKVIQQKSIQNVSHQSQSKSSISQTSVTKTKGASINQIVSKITSGVTAKSTSVNVTSTTPTLELSKTNTNALSLGSTKVSANEVNDDKVSTTTNESGVSSSILKNEETESAIKAVTSAATNSGNLVIRISTKTHSVETSQTNRDKDRNTTNLHKGNKFEIKRDLSNVNLSKSNSVITATDGNSTKTSASLNGKQDINDKNEREIKAINSSKFTLSNHNDDEDDDDDDNSIDGRKLVVDVPNEDSCENEVGTSKATFESDDIDSGRGSDIIRLSCDDMSIGSPQSTTLSIKTPESISVSSDTSSKLVVNITSTTSLSANSAVLVSPPPTPSPKSESDPCVTIDAKSCSPNGPLDLSMATNKKDSSYQKTDNVPQSMRAIYEPPPPKPKHCVNPAVLRGLFPQSSAPNKMHPSFMINSTPSQTSRQTNAIQSQSSLNSSSVNLNANKKERSVNTAIITSNSMQGRNQSANSSRNRSPSHHHHHNHKNYSVITPDPNRFLGVPKIVIRNIGSPPSITSHFNYPTNH